jgi:DNA-dependent RNA polymerase auxiliary subunit epsilon
MDKEDIKFLGYKVALEWVVFFIFFGIGILSYVKGYFLKNYFGLISFIKLNRKKNQNELLNHEFFKLTYTIENKEEISYSLPEEVKNIAIDVIKTELRYVKMLLKANINYLILGKNDYSVEEFCERIIIELNDERDLFRNILRKKGYDTEFVKDISDETFIYYKFAFKGILLAKKELSLYNAIMRILDIFLITFVTYKTTILKKIKRAYGNRK